MKRNYETLSMEVLQVECGQQVLKGSITTCKIDVTNVSVEDYDNGFASETNGFKELDFD